MSNAVLFGIISVISLVFHVILATVVFYYMIPKDHRCPNCDAPTVRVQSRLCNLFLPWLRTSWCYNCGWEGFLRDGPISTPTHTEELAPKP